MSDDDVYMFLWMLGHGNFNKRKPGLLFCSWRGVTLQDLTSMTETYIIIIIHIPQPHWQSQIKWDKSIQTEVALTNIRYASDMVPSSNKKVFLQSLCNVYIQTQ